MRGSLLPEAFPQGAGEGLQKEVAAKDERNISVMESASWAKGPAWGKQRGQWMDRRSRVPIKGEVCLDQISCWGREVKRRVG